MTTAGALVVIGTPGNKDCASHVSAPSAGSYAWHGACTHCCSPTLTCTYTSGLQLVDFLSAAPRSSDGSGGGSRLEHLGILAVEPVLDTEDELLPPGPDLVLRCGVTLAHEQGAEGVCTAIGDLVQSGVLPALKEVSSLQPKWLCCPALDVSGEQVHMHLAVPSGSCPHHEVTRHAGRNMPCAARERRPEWNGRVLQWTC